MKPGDQFLWVVQGLWIFSELLIEFAAATSSCAWLECSIPLRTYRPHHGYTPRQCSGPRGVLIDLQGCVRFNSTPSHAHRPQGSNSSNAELRVLSHMIGRGLLQYTQRVHVDLAYYFARPTPPHPQSLDGVHTFRSMHTALSYG